ncbi:MAG: GtrA family protein [Paludibacteraceae bacterium]|nr:GtrA family protein [Paludibacteraceae bacterium]
MFKEFKDGIVVLLHQDNKKSEFLRFAIVGVIAAIIHYAIYFFLYHFINVSVAYTIGYLLSWFCNLYLTSRFTFHRKATLKKSAGFAGAHVVNYFMHILLLQFFLWIGMHKALAPMFVMGIATIINFFLVRFVFKSGNLK